MIIGIGIDLVRTGRIQRAVERWNQRFLDRIFTPQEQRHCRTRADSHRHLSGRFAVKEAFFKALGAGWAKGARWNDVEVLNAADGSPFVILQGATQKRLADLGNVRIHVSISHDADYAVGQVILSSDHQKSPAIE